MFESVIRVTAGRDLRAYAALRTARQHTGSSDVVGYGVERTRHVHFGRKIVNWREATHAAAVRHGIEPAERFVAQIAVESAEFDQDVISQQRLGPSGGRGIGQLMTPMGNWVASMLGVRQDDFWADPARQLDGAAWLMKRLLTRYGDWAYALAAYNAGAGNLARWLDPRDTLLPFGETVRYVARIIGLSEACAQTRLLPSLSGMGAEPASIFPDSAFSDSAPHTRAPISMPALSADPGVPYSADDEQWLGWTCSLHTIQQALESVGSSMSYSEVYHLLVDVRGLADSSGGFHDHTGQRMAQLFRELGYDAYAEYPVDFDRVWEDAGHEPICLSIDGHNQWMFVRSRADENTLNLSNSAPGRMGLEQTITRWEWAHIGGGASAVHINIPEEEDPSVIAALQARLVELAGVNEELGRQVQDQDRRLMSLVEGLAHLSDVVVPAIVTAPTETARQALAEQAYQIRAARLGPRRAGVTA